MDKNPRKLKVLYVITKSNFGGAQKYVHDLATELNPNLFDVAVVLGGEGVLAKKLTDALIRTISLPSLDRDINFFKDFSSLVALWKIFRAERPDVVHVNSAKAGGIGAFVARIALVPRIIFTAHGWAWNEARPKYQKTLIKFFSWLTIFFSHKTIAVSDFTAEQVASWPFVRRKIVTIKNGVKENPLLPREEARAFFAKNGASVNPSTFIVGTIAELHKNKGLSLAIEAIARLSRTHPELRYVILGDGEERERLGTLIRDRGLSDRIFLLGFAEDAYRYLSGLDAFLLPSQTEALGLVLIEAGFAKLPVIATNVGGIPEIIHEKETGLLVEANDPQSLVNALRYIVEHKEKESAKFGMSLYSFVKKEFSLARMAKKTISLYESKKNS